MTEIRILITGDFCPINRLESLSSTSNPEEVLSELAENITHSDLAITNLECPITSIHKTKPKTGPSLKGSIESIDFITKAGFNLVTLANNHIMDFGDDGLKDTLYYLDKVGLPYLGAGLNLNEAAAVFYYQKENIKLAIINVAENEWSTTHGKYPGANPIDTLHVFNLILEAKKVADVILVISHGGHEMYELPSPRIKTLFHGFIDMGADAVINHHPHCVSGFEVYNDKPIFYSLGNFLFDHPEKRNTIWNVGQAVNLIITDNGIQFENVYFEQCNETPKINVLKGESKFSVDQHVNELNMIISDSEKLEVAFDEYCATKHKMYSSFLEPHKNKYISALQNRKLVPSLWSPYKKLLLENLIRCEAHRDVVLKILKK